MFDSIRKMLPYISNEDIRKDKGLQILKGAYKIPTSIKEIAEQYKIR